MKEFIPILTRAGICKGLAEQEILSAFKCLNAFVKSYQKGSYIFAEGDSAEFIGVVLSGEIQAQKTDFDGNVSIISRLFPSAMVAAVAAYSGSGRLPFDVVAASDCQVLCINNQSLIRPCCKACAFHIKIIENMLGVIADKNIELSQKIDILTRRTVREKILAFLYAQSKRARSNSFTISLSRRQMSEYLSTNRSALSRELSIMQSEGILRFEGNRFVLLGK